MKPLFSIICILLFRPAISQTVRIPDPNFKQRIIALGYDVNNDNQIQESEALRVKKLYVNGLGIVNIDGISSFLNLEELGCYNNNLSSLDVSKLHKLKYLYAYNNRIESLTIKGLVNLEHLHVQNNILLSSLDIAGLSGLTEMKITGNRITKLDVSGFTRLELIDAADNRLESVSLTKAPKLKLVNLNNNPLPVTVNITGLANLEYFTATGCNLLYINFSGTAKLREYHW